MNIMRFTRSVVIAALLILATPAPVFAVSKEMQELQRDIAQLQDQVRTLQSAIDQKMATLQTLTQQALDASNKTNTSVSVLNAGVISTLERELHNALTPIAGLTAKVDNTNNDVAEVRNQMADLNNQMNKMMQILNDIGNNVKVLQAAPAQSQPPPPTASQTPPPPDGETVFTNAVRDEAGGKLVLAISEYQDFIKFYPNDPNAARAQYNIGNCHYTNQQFDVAADDFDKVVTAYPEDMKLTPRAYFMKGMALRTVNKPLAIATWRKVIAKYPASDDAAQAKEQLRAIGATVAPAPPAKKKTAH
jgi:TolA-binding protein